MTRHIAVILLLMASGAIAEPLPVRSQRTLVVGGQGYFPVALRLKDRRIAVVLRGGGPHLSIKGRIDFVYSSDEGKTKPATVIDLPVDDRNPAFGQSREGNLV